MPSADDRLEHPVNFENIPAQEEMWRQEISEMTVTLQEKRKNNQQNEILRGVHPKSHGCLNAEFFVKDNLNSDLQVGLFSTPGKRFCAKIRYSNADVLKRSDFKIKKDRDGQVTLKSGSRGMAIKVLDVDGPVLLEDNGARNQDFLMINTPEFAFRNVRDYRRLTQALLASKNFAEPDLFFLPLKLMHLGILDADANLLPVPDDEPPEHAALRGLFTTSDIFKDYTVEDLQGMRSSHEVVEKIQETAVRNPIEAPYFTAAPFRFGPDRVAKFKVEPLDGVKSPDAFSAEEIETLDESYLSKALAASIATGEVIKLSFQVQVASASSIEGKIDEMVENASLAWDEDQYPFQDVAQLIIKPCDQGEELVDRCKSQLFSPWHALHAHEPLGGINRLRKPVYTESANFRRASETS